MASVDREHQRRFAVEVVERLRRAGHEAYWAGGCVRDQLLGLSPKDYDVATSATPDQIVTVFGRRRTLAVGAAFGVITVLGPKAAGQIEVATFREDQAYRDGRHPESVTYSTARLDAQRRDFTINGLFYDPQCDQVIDHVDGRADLERRVVRAIGDPHARFGEDKLRMLRAVRFAAAYGFRLDPATQRAIHEMADTIHLVSAERIGAELQQMLLLPRRSDAMRLLRASALLEHLLPEVSGLGAGRAWDETLRVLAALAEPTFPLALAGLLHRVEGQDVVAAIGRRCRWTLKAVRRAAWILAHYRDIGCARSLPWPQLQPLLVQDGTAELLELHRAIASPASPELAYCRRQLALPPDELDPDPLLTGDDLVAHGMRPGKVFRVLLDRVRAAQLLGEISTKEEALDLTDRLLAEQSRQDEGANDA